MDVEKAARAFQASLVNDLHTKYEEDVARLKAQFREEFATLKAHHDASIASVSDGLSEDPIAWMVRYYPMKAAATTRTATGTKRDRSPPTNGVVPAIDGSADEVQASKCSRVSDNNTSEQDTNGRPKRTVKQAASRDYHVITSSLPLKLPAPTTSAAPEQSTDLQFAAHLLTNLCNPRLHAINQPFLSPVSTEMNPDYHDIISPPMDLETMSIKLSGGKYSSAEELKQDFELMIANCNEYNPLNHPIRDCGIRLRRYFEEWWNGKERWERALAREMASKWAEESDIDEEDEEVDPLLLNVVPTGDDSIDGPALERLRETIARLKEREEKGGNGS